MAKIKIENIRPEWVFLIIFLLLATASSILIPMGAGNDEPTHIARVEQLTQGKILPQAVEHEKLDPSINPVFDTSSTLYGGHSDHDLIRMMTTNSKEFTNYKGNYRYPTWTSPNLITSGQYGKDKMWYAFSNTAINPPIAYLPQIIGFSLSRLITHNTWWIVAGTRLSGILFLALAAFYAIRKIPIGKWMMTVFCLLPNVIITSAVVTADLMTFASCLIFICSFLQAWLTPKNISTATWAALGISSICLGCVKLSYMPLTLLLLLLPLLRPELKTRRNMLTIAGMLTATVLIFGAWYLCIRNINTGALFSPEVHPKEQEHWILSHPFFYGRQIIKILLSSHFIQISSFGVLGARMGVVSDWILVPLFIVAAMTRDQREYQLPIPGRQIKLVVAAFILEFSLIVTLIATAVYIQFNSVGSLTIEGIQTRYFLPIVPMIMVALVIFARWVTGIGTDTVRDSVQIEKTRLSVGLLISGLLISLVFFICNFGHSLFGLR